MGYLPWYWSDEVKNPCSIPSPWSTSRACVAERCQCDRKGPGDADIVDAQSVCPVDRCDHRSGCRGLAALVEGFLGAAETEPADLGRVEECCSLHDASALADFDHSRLDARERSEACRSGGQNGSDRIDLLLGPLLLSKLPLAKLPLLSRQP